MNRRLALWTGLGVLLASRAASAQDATIGYQGLPYKATGESNTGIQLSDRVLLHAGVGVEAGYDTNVFYQDTNTTSSAIYVVLPYLELTNATRTGPTSSLFTFDARVGLQYRRYQSDNPVLTPFRNAWMPTAGLLVSTGGGAQFGFGIGDTFSRIEDAPYNPGQQPIERDNNQASIEGRWSPGGGRLTTTLRYTNMIDYFQDQTFAYGNSVTNFVTLDAAWRWLPKTAVFIDVRDGYITYLNTSDANAEGKYSSLPLYVTAGLRGQLTTTTTATLTVGYQNGFYSSGASTSGLWGSTYADVMFTARISDLSRAVLGYRHDFENSVIANFSLNDSVYASYVQQIAGRLALDLSGRYAHIEYQGFVDTPGHVAERTDNVYQVGASLDYFLRNWAYLGVGYSLLKDKSDYSLNGDSASYVKQQIFGRLGITY
jgi:hypothetical protein